MYHIVKIQPGQVIPGGRTEAVGREDRLRTFLAQEVLTASGAYYQNPLRYLEDHRPDRGDLDDEFGDPPEPRVATEEMLVLVCDLPPEENEFGRVSP